MRPKCAIKWGLGRDAFSFVILSERCASKEPEFFWASIARVSEQRIRGPSTRRLAREM